MKIFGFPYFPLFFKHPTGLKDIPKETLEVVSS